MDALAKLALHNWAETPSCQPIEGEPWSIWNDGVKIVNEINSKLYDIVHRMQIIDYWVKKNKFPSNQAEHIHWEALEKAMKESKLARRTFMAKHAWAYVG